MIISLFRTFDPIRRFLNLNLRMSFLFLTLPTNIKILNRKFRASELFSFVGEYLKSEIKATINNTNKNSKINILMALFFIILILNLCGIFPYIFTITAQTVLTLSLALPV
jgi:F0F1-type ATP synthase membrane subunit a